MTVTPTEDARAQGGPSVLLVDDNRANLIALAAVLKPLHVRIVEARSGPEAVGCIEREPFAVVLLDVQMPGMDGFETARRIRAMANGREAPIIFLTAIHADEAYVRRGYAHGGADYITKPFDVEILRARVRAFTDLYRQREESHRARVEQQTRKLGEVERRLAAFERIATAALETDDVSAFLHTLLTIFMGAAEAAETAAIMLRTGSELSIAASIGFDAAAQEQVRIPVGTGFAGVIAASGRPFLLRGDELRHLETPWIRDAGLSAILGAPLVADGHVIGVALIGSRGADGFSGAESRLFNAMVERAAWVVSRHRARERLHAVLAASPALIAIWRPPDHRCEFANEAWRNQYALGELVGKRAADIGAPPEMLAALDRVFRRGVVEHHDIAVAANWSPEVQGKEFFFRMSVHPLRNHSGVIDAVLTFTIDRTDEVRAHRQLEASEQERARLLELERAAREAAESANRAKDEFLATVSHELRTPLNAILGWSSNARRGAPPSVERPLAIIERNARAQAKIIEDVLDLSRIISGNLRLDIVPTDLTNAIFAAVEAIRPTAEGKGVKLSVDVDGELGIIAADADRIQQVVSNLLLNAVKFTPKDGSVLLEARRGPKSVAIRVNDTGQGIAPDFLPSVFEPFRQADGSTTRRHGGLGLGLAIVNQLVQAHRGEIRAESAGLGKGASFTITLPVCGAPCAEPVASADVPDGTMPRLDGVRVLVLDDQEDARVLVREVLEQQGAVVETAATAGEAIAKVTTFAPDVVFSDIGMPHADGYSFIRELRALSPERGGRTPAVALTAYARGEDGRLALSAGFQVHVAKPVQPMDLVSLVVRLRQPEARA